MYEDKVTFVKTGDCVHQRPGIVQDLFDYSPDMEFLEFISPADYKTIEMPGPCLVQMTGLAGAEWLLTP